MTSLDRRSKAKRRIYKIGEGELVRYRKNKENWFLMDNQTGRIMPIKIVKDLIGRRIELLAKVVREVKK